MDRAVLEAAVSWYRRGWSVVLGTVVRTWGSAPRPVGSMVTLRGDGALRGSVSGGCIEDDLILRIQAGEFRTGKPCIVSYGMSANEAHRFGLPCGGTLQIVMESVSGASGLDEVLARIRQGQIVERTVNVETGEASVRRADKTGTLSFDGGTLRTIYGPRYRLLVVGAGQLSEYVAQMALPLGYRVTVCDPREEYLNEWHVEHTEVSSEMPDDLIARVGLDAHTAVVTLTHDPKIDDLALIEALKSDAFYIGAVGSRANNAKRRERLKLFDLDDRRIAALHGPIGLYIGARTPPEIAVSILAEMTAIRHRVRIVQTHLLREVGLENAKTVSARFGYI